MSAFEFAFSVVLLLAFVAWAIGTARHTPRFSDHDWNPRAMSDRWRGEREFGQMRRAR